MDVEEELDYEGPLFSEDQYFQEQDLVTEDSSREATSEETTKTPLFFHNQDSEITDSLDVSLQSIKTTTDPEVKELERQPQTVQVIFSSLIPIISKSDDSSKKQKKSAPNQEAQVLEDHLHLNGDQNVKQRSILKFKENYGATYKVIDKCMSFLCSIPSSSELLSCANEVFENICFQEFFDGECLGMMCPKDHHNLPNITNCHSFTVQIASLYVISKSTAPKIEILKSLVQYFAGCCDSVRILALAKCIAKLKSSDKIEFAQYLVKHLANLTEMQNAVMWVLFMTYADLVCQDFNLLLDNLGIFQQDSTIHFDLFNFLNYRSHVLPRRNLVKLIEDILAHPPQIENSDLKTVVVGFFDRLSEEEKQQMSTVISRFIREYKIGPLSKQELLTDVGGNTIPNLHSSGSAKKEVKFVEQITVVEIPDGGLATNQDRNIQPFPNFDEDVNGSNCERKLDSDYSIFKDNVGSIIDVLNNLCPNWILKGDCRRTLCTAAHSLEEDHLIGLPTEKINLAAEFLIETSDHPNIKVLEVFINVQNKRCNYEKLLLFRKCASKLTAADSSKLTKLVLNRLSRRLTRWAAIEVMLTPNLLDLGNKYNDGFYFCSSLLEAIMVDAIKNKNIESKIVYDEILRRVSQLQPNEMENIMATTVAFFRKFVINQFKLPPCPDLIPMESVIKNKFSSNFKTELHKGITNKYFVVCLMLKFVVEKGGILKDEALDALYTFLTTQFSKARILKDILESCIFIKEPTRSYVKDLLGNVGLCCILRLFEDGLVAEASEMFVVLRKFYFDFFKQELKFFQISQLELAIICCTLTVQCDEFADAIDTLLNRCLQPMLDNSSVSSLLINRMNVVTEEMFGKFICKLMWCESITLFNGIFSRQKSLTYPLNILKFYESTLRTTFVSSLSQKTRQACLRLFLEMEDAGEHIELQKATCRSLLLNVMTEVYESHDKIVSKSGLPNLFHPLMKKLIALCIKAKAYSQFTSTGDQITLYSSMSVDEIKIYLLWWVFYLLRARKRAQIHYFSNVNLKIILDCVQEDFRLPIHFTLRNIDVSVNECGDRLFKALKSLLKVPTTSSVFRVTGRSTFQLSSVAVMELSNVVINCLLTHVSNECENDLELCSFCFEKNEIGFDLV